MKRLCGYIGPLSVVVLLVICACSPVMATDSGSPIDHSVTLLSSPVEVGETATLTLHSRDLDWVHGADYPDQLTFTAPDDDEPSPANEWSATELQRAQDGWYTQTYTKIFTHAGKFTCSITADDTPPGWNNDDSVCVGVEINVGVVYVKWDSPGPTFDGTSWATAYHTVQAGLNDAAAISADEVWVAEGTYTPDNTTHTFTLLEGIGLYGGFAGTETSRDERDCANNETTLDGYDHDTSVVTCSEGLTRDTVIDGFTITHGHGKWLAVDENERAGGGIYCAASSPTISNNIITDNSAVGDTISGEGTGKGGGIYCRQASPKIVCNRITDNDTWADGSQGYGGGIYCELCPSVEIIGNVISGHSIGDEYGGGLGGGIYAYESNALIANNTITNNEATGYSGGYSYSGGIYVSQALPVDMYPLVTLANNIIAFNSAGIHRQHGALTLRNNCVYRNEVYDYSYELDPGEGDIGEDPKLVGGYHLSTESPNVSPCIGAGDNAYVESVTDIDGEYRIQEENVDIGADEVTGDTCYVLTLSADPNPCPVESGEGVATITAFLYDPLTGNGVPNIEITFEITSGAGGTLSDSEVTTDPDGFAEVTLTSTSIGRIVVTATADSSGCSLTTLEQAVDVLFYGSSDVPWPMFMHDEQHTGMSSFVDTVATQDFSGGPAWQVALPAIIDGRPDDMYSFDSSPVVADGLVIVGTWTSRTCGDVRAFEARTDEPFWTFDDRNMMYGVMSTPCIDGGRVYVSSANGYLYCLDLDTGRMLWKAALFQSAPVPSYSSPVVHDGVVYAASTSGLVYAFGAASGWPVPDWPVDLEEGTLSSPAIATVDGHDYLLIGSGDGDNITGHVHRIDLDSSQPSVDSLDLLAPVDSSASISGNYAFIGCDAYQQENNRDLYRLTIGSFGIDEGLDLVHEARTTPALGFGFVYVGTDTGNILFQRVAADLANTQFAHAFGAGGTNYFIGSAALTNASDVSGSILYTGNDDGYLYARRAGNVANAANDVSAKAKYRDNIIYGKIRSSPAIAYIADSSGNLDRWVFITTEAGGGKLLAFRTDR